MERLLERWTDAVNVVSIGATSDQGGSRCRVVQVGGERALPFLKGEGDLPHPPAMALEVYDDLSAEQAEAIKGRLDPTVHDPVAWAAAAEARGADLVLLSLSSAHPDNKDASADDVLKTVCAVKNATRLPLIVWGCGDAEKDNKILPACSQALAGERCLMGSATQNNYRNLAATCIADGHNIVSESPLDISICKQMNILLSEIDFPKDRIIIYPTNGAVGYGFEYGYSIMERTRLAALNGDQMMACPLIALCGWESWRAKEAKAPAPGGEPARALAWEVATAVGYLHCGVDIVTLLNPAAIPIVKDHVASLMDA